MIEIINFRASTIEPNPKEVTYWVDLNEDPLGGIIKSWDGEGHWRTIRVLEGTIVKVEQRIHEWVTQKLAEQTEWVEGVVQDMVDLVHTWDGRIIYLEGEVVRLEEVKQDKLIPGFGIAIDENNVISSTVDLTLYRVVPELPTENIDDTKIYIVFDPDGVGSNTHKEYVYLNDKWELLGEYADYASRPDFLKEVQERKDADAALQHNIDAEAAERQRQDNILKQLVDGNNDAINDKLDAEITRSTNKDQEHTNAINSEISRATEAERSLSVDISNVNNSLTNEVTRAKAAEKTNANNLTKEITRATNAETALSNRTTLLESDNTTNKSNISTLQNNLGPIKTAWDKRGTKDGLLTLGDNNLIQSQYLPSYVDDVIDVYATYDVSPTNQVSNIKLYSDAAHTTAIVGESGKSYIDVTDDHPGYQFRWSGTAWVQITSGGLILGEITGTAYDGGKGKKTTDTVSSLPNWICTETHSILHKASTVQLETYIAKKDSTTGTYSGPSAIFKTIEAATSSQAGVMTASDKVSLDNIKSTIGNYVTLDSEQTITGTKKITNYLSFVSGTRKLNISGDEIKMYSYASGGSAQSIKFCDSNGNTLSSLGYMVNNNSLDWVYLGTGYEESKHWVKFTPTKTTIRTSVTSLTGSLRIPVEGGVGIGIQTSDGIGLVMYDSNHTYLAQNLGTTCIRSGSTDLYHRRTATDYTILDTYNTPYPLCQKGVASAYHVDLTDTTVNATNFVNYDSGAYRVSNGTGSTDMYIKFQGSGSTSGLELYTSWKNDSSLRFRKIVDNNKISGSWSYLLDNKNWSTYVKFDSLTDKPLISVDTSNNSLVKRTSQGYIYCTKSGIAFYDTPNSNDAVNGWVITTDITNFGGTSKDLIIKQHYGTGGELLINSYRVATAKDKYVMSKYTIDASSLNENTYYPVTIRLTAGHNYRIEILVQLDSGTKPSWSTNNKGFAVRFIEEVQGYGWGTIDVRRRILDFSYGSCIKSPISNVGQMTNSSTEFIYVRGGGKYFFFVSGSSFDTPEPILRTSTYTITEQDVSPLAISQVTYNMQRNMIMSDDVNTEPVGNKIAKRDSNGYLKAIRYYTVTPVEDSYSISHVPYFHNSDGYIRKCSLDRFNRQLSFNKLGGIIKDGNEFNFLPSTYSNTALHINYKSYDVDSNGSLNMLTSIKDVYIDNGQTGTAYVNAQGYKKTGSTDSYALTGGGGHKLISDFVDKTTDQNIGAIKCFFTSKVDGNYATRGIVLRETNMGRDANKSELYAPSLSFHWENVAQAIMSLHTNGQIYFTQTTTDGNAIYVNARGYVKSDSDSIHVLTGDGGHQVMYIEPNASSLVKRTSEGHIKTKDILADCYMLHNASDNPYLKFAVAGNTYFIQAAASGIWMGPSATDKSLIINSTGQAGLGILPNGSYKLYVNGTIRSSGTINAGETVDLNYGYINVSRPSTIENASCFSWIKSTVEAFALGFNSSNQIVLGSGKTDKTLTPWLTIGNADSTSRFQSHLETQTVSTEDGRFNHNLASLTLTGSEIKGTICITLPNAWNDGMNIYEVYIYEYNYNFGGSKLLISGYNDSSNGGQWVNCRYSIEGNYTRGVRFGYRNGKCCILLGATSSIWAYPQVHLANVYAGYTRKTEWKKGYTIEVLTSESDVTNVTTVAQSSCYADKFIRVGSSDSYVLLGGGGHKLLSEISGGGTASSVAWANVTGKPTFATVATSGSYNDLTNKPTIPSLSGYATEAWVNAKGYTTNIGTVTTVKVGSSSYSPSNGVVSLPAYPSYTLPTASSTTLGGVKVGAGLSISNGVLSATGGGVADSVDWDNVVGKPSWIGSSKPSYSWSEISSKPTWIGSSKPSYAWSEITSKPTFATVATSGSYNDLRNKPTIPAAYTLPAASTSALGGIKVGYPTSGKNYKVQLDSSNNAYVNVPWTDTNTTYGLATTSANGLLKQLNGSTAQYMRGDGTWATPPNTTYSVATTSSNGLMSAADKAKLDNMSSETGIQAISKTYNLTHATSMSNSARVVVGIPSDFEYGKRAKLSVTFYGKTSSSGSSGYDVYYNDVILFESNQDSYYGSVTTALGTDYTSPQQVVVSLQPYNSSAYSALLYFQTTTSIFNTVSNFKATLKPI